MLSLKSVNLQPLEKMCSNQAESVADGMQLLISDKGKTLVKITPASQHEQGSWLGCMRGRGKIKGDIISPAEDSESWKVLSE